MIQRGERLHYCSTVGLIQLPPTYYSFCFTSDTVSLLFENNGAKTRLGGGERMEGYEWGEKRID